MLRAQSNTPSKTSDKTQNLTPESRQQGYAVSFAPALNWGMDGIQYPRKPTSGCDNFRAARQPGGIPAIESSRPTTRPGRLQSFSPLPIETVTWFEGPRCGAGHAQTRASLLLTIRNTLYKLLLMEETLNLDAAFSALADPTRRAILARLAQGEANVMELAMPFEMTQPAISQHLKVLENAGIVARRVDGTRRPRRLATGGIEAMGLCLARLPRALKKLRPAGQGSRRRGTTEDEDKPKVRR